MAETTHATEILKIRSPSYYITDLFPRSSYKKKWQMRPRYQTLCSASLKAFIWGCFICGQRKKMRMILTWGRESGVRF